ncbi:hypothetical protein KC614_02220 [candidate division WWE3 bacterium]|uniref:DUF8173 domain-containing protein n=1 Tax=candidate division WWE3 bacterium TaxID=2053526 RepID=A0A955LJR2_UNCKA|nr:hypothetical protein [candidate division WWE3 bacterium]
MKRFAFVLTSILLLFTASSAFVAAKVVSTENNVTVSADEVIDDDLFIGAESVDIDGTVNGDVFVGAGMVDVLGTVNGNLVVAGGTVNVTGNIGGALVVFGGTINVSDSEVKNSLLLFGGDVSTDSQTVVGNSLVLGAGNARIDGTVGNSVVGGSGLLSLGAEVGKDVTVGVGQLTLNKAANVKGDVVYVSDQEADVDSGALVSGDVTQTIPESHNKSAENTFRDFSRRAAAGYVVWSFLSLLLVGAVLMYFGRAMVEGTAGVLEHNLLKSLLVGFLAMLVFGPLFLALLITVIGIQLAFILLTVFGLLVFLSKFFVAILVGRWICNVFSFKNVNYFVSFGIGLLVIVVVGTMPYVGFASTALVVLSGLGAFLLRSYESYRNVSKSADNVGHEDMSAKEPTTY